MSEHSSPGNAPDITGFSQSVRDGRCLEVWFNNNVTAEDRAWLLEAINEKALRANAQRPASAESIARTICLSYGRDPEELSDPLEMCDAHNRPVSLWRVYEEQAEAILAAYAVSSTERS